jgi:hypothetical protein
MSLAEALYSHADQLRRFVDEVTREVAILQDKFDHQEALHEAFGDDPTIIGLATAKAKLDKCEELLIVAKSRQDAAYNRYAATLESRDKTVASCAKAAASPSSSHGGKTKEKDNKSLKKELKEPDEWKDHTSETPLKHLHALAACKSMFALLWKLLDEYMEEMKDSGDEAATSKDVRLSELLTHADLMDKIDNMSVRETLLGVRPQHGTRTVGGHLPHPPLQT